MEPYEVLYIVRIKNIRIYFTLQRQIQKKLAMPLNYSLATIYSGEWWTFDLAFQD